MENGGSGAHWPWLFDDETTEIYRQYVNLHYAMLDYLNKEGALAFDTGRSLMDFEPGDTYDFMLGPDIFVAPMLESGTSRTVVLPDEGDWVYLFDASITGTEGDTLTLDVPLTDFPVFLRADSDVQMTLLATLD